MHFNSGIWRIKGNKLENLPDLKKTTRIENERDEFRRALANCKTKEEARRLRVSKSLELQREARTMSDSEFIVMKMMAIFEEFSDFMKSEE